MIESGLNVPTAVYFSMEKEAAFRVLAPLSNEGDSFASFYLAQILEGWDDAENDMDTLISTLLAKSAQSGNSHAAINLWMSSHSTKSAEFPLIIALENDVEGKINGRADYGYFLAAQIQAEQDIARKHLANAVEKGYPYALMKYASLLEDECLIEQARSTWLRGGKIGVNDCWYMLAFDLATREPRNLGQAAIAYWHAAASIPDAEHYFGMMLLEGCGLPRCQGLGLYHIRNAARRESYSATYLLSRHESIAAEERQDWDHVLQNWPEILLRTASRRAELIKTLVSLEISGAP